MTALNTLVSESVDLVVHCARGPHGPQVTEILAVEDLASGRRHPVHGHRAVRPRRAGCTADLDRAQLPSRAGRLFRQAGLDVRDALGAPTVLDRAARLAS